MPPIHQLHLSRPVLAANLLRTIQYTHPPDCPCHANVSVSAGRRHSWQQQQQRQRQRQHDPQRGILRPSPSLSSSFSSSSSHSSSYTNPTSSPQREYAFELATSSIRFGPGSTAEVGMDLANLRARRVMIVTDRNVRKIVSGPVSVAVSAIERERERERELGEGMGPMDYEVFDRVAVEPKDILIKTAIEATKKYRPDAFLAIGGGSVIDTAKLMNLYYSFPDAEFLDFVNAPLGKGKPITRALHPLIAIPTTAGTGSETTGTAIFDLTSRRAKTGIAHRNLRPTLGICDPLNTRTMPRQVHASSGLDVLCHALESWTAIPYTERTPRPANPMDRPAYQGANPISDIFSLKALKSTVENLPRAVKDPGDDEAQEQMLLAATLAGVGFGNAGVHLCHGMSYPISGQNPSGYAHPGYHAISVNEGERSNQGNGDGDGGGDGLKEQVRSSPLIPHGVSVAVTAPAVFRFTAASNPDRHLAAAECFGVDISQIKRESAGEVLSEALMKFLLELGDQPRGLRDLGFERKDLDALVEGTIPQKRVLMLAPSLERDDLEREREQLRGLFEEAMSF